MTPREQAIEAMALILWKGLQDAPPKSDSELDQVTMAGYRDCAAAALTALEALGWRQPVDVDSVASFSLAQQLSARVSHVPPEHAAEVVHALMEIGWRPVGADEAVVPREATVELEAALLVAIDKWDDGEVVHAADIWTAALAAAEAGKREAGDG